MADWSAQVFSNEYLPDGATDVHAIVTVTSANTGTAGGGDASTTAEAIIIDGSGSMTSPSSKIVAARKAAAAAVMEIPDGTWFTLIAGLGLAEVIYPRGGRAMVQADDRTRQEAARAAAHLQPTGGTAIGQWLVTALQQFRTCPAAQRHAILLTDGKNEGETPEQFARELTEVTGEFQCDCRGVGADWDVAELRGIATTLLGSVDLIADPDEMAADFQALMRAAAQRGVPDAHLRVWAPQGAEVLFVKQVAPTIEDLTNRGHPVSNLITEYPTGAWGDESRDYHVAIRVGARPIGSEQLAGRVQVEVGGSTVAQGLIKAIWSDDSGLTTRINPAVAHYTGQAELADAIQEGLAAKAAGDEEEATAKLGRAAKLAAATGNEEATTRLKKVVDIEDADQGTVRLKREASKLDEMALDTASTKTTRVRPQR